MNGEYIVLIVLPQFMGLCFKFWDLDDNCWEILSNPKDGYTWIFEQGDQEGRGHMDRNFRDKRPDR